MEPQSSRAGRVAVESDLDGVTRSLWLAFRDDPLWSWAIPDHGRLEPLWRFYVKSALRYPWVWIAGAYAAAAVWIPPGGSELTEEEQIQLDSLVHELVGDRGSSVLALMDRLEAAHPRDRPHYYLSLLGTHPSHRGAGLGMALLAENLARIDGASMPSYLESSNPANDRRYERLGFKRIGELSTPDGGHTVTTMWREPG